MPYLADSIDASKAAMIVVDMENDFIAMGAPLETPAGRAMLPTLKRTLAFCRERGIRYSEFIHGLSKAGLELDRKMLSEIAIADAAAFDAIVAQAKAAIAA